MKFKLNAAAGRSAGILSALMVAAGCASAEPAADSAAAGPDPRIGPEVDRICFGANISGWKTVDKQDNVLLLNKSVNQWYRVELLGACRYSTLRSALAIGIDQRPAGGCITRGDYIIVEDSPSFTQRCSIQRINEWYDDAPAPGEEEMMDE